MPRLANGSIGVMVTYADMPATMLLCLRMAFAAAALGIVVLVSGSWRDLRSPERPSACSGISIALALNLILYFLAIRYTGVAVAIFLSLSCAGVPGVRRAADPQGDRRSGSCTSRSRSAWPAWR